jgi:hypothetical protein
MLRDMVLGVALYGFGVDMGLAVDAVIAERPEKLA